MFKPCPVPPGFMFHDNLIRRISIFGQSYELKLGFVIQLALMSKFKESLIIVIIKQLKHLYNMVEQRLATGSFTFGASIPRDLLLH